MAIGMDFSALNWFDTVVLSIVFVSTLMALFRGFLKAFFSLVTWLCSGSITGLLYSPLVSALKGKIHNEKVVMTIASVGVFIFVFIVIAIISSKILNLLKDFRGGGIDRTLGFAFGFFRGILIVCLMFFSINMTSSMLQIGTKERPGPDWFANAQAYDALNSSTASLVKILPADVPQRMIAYVDQFKEMSMDAVQKQLAAAPVPGNAVAGGDQKTLSEDDRKIIKKIIAALPKEELDEMYKKYEGGSTGLSDLERMSVFKEIVTLYKNDLAKGSISPELIVSEDEVKKVTDSLEAIHPEGEPSADQQSEETGYKDSNIKQFDRLIDNVQQ